MLELGNWGVRFGALTPNDETCGAAVIGVESGPVDIAYRDTDGKTQVVDLDRHGSADGADRHSGARIRRSGHFAELLGSFTDDNSGLRKDTFRLYVDHDDDR